MSNSSPTFILNINILIHFKVCTFFGVGFKAARQFLNVDGVIVYQHDVGTEGVEKFTSLAITSRLL